jgi:RNA polymerase sigma-32 factor
LSGIESYLRDIKRHPLLDRREEGELARRYRATGDPELARRLATAHLRLVVKIARQYRWAHAHPADLIEEGNVGLLCAVRKYDPGRGVRLSTYATWWIRALILRFIVANYRMVRVGTTPDQRKIMFRLARERSRLEQQLGTAADAAQLAHSLGVSEAAVVTVGRYLDEPEVRLDAPLRDAEGHERQRTLPANDDARPDRVVERRDFMERVLGAVDEFERGLATRDRTIFRLRWREDERETLTAVGARFGITRERARQLEVKILSRLREHVRKVAA